MYLPSKKAGNRNKKIHATEGVLVSRPLSWHTKFKTKTMKRAIRLFTNLSNLHERRKLKFKLSNDQMQFLCDTLQQQLYGLSPVFLLSMASSRLDFQYSIKIKYRDALSFSFFIMNYYILCQHDGRQGMYQNVRCGVRVEIFDFCARNQPMAPKHLSNQIFKPSSHQVFSWS